MIKRIVKLTFQEDKIDEFLSIFENSKFLIRSFPGCQHVELLRAKRQPAVFFTFSIWDSEEALEHYRHSKLFGQTWAKTKALFADRPQAWTVVWMAEG